MFYHKHKQHLVWTLFSLLMLGTAVSLILLAARDTVVFFFSPSELVQQSVSPDRRLRIGGLVANGSVQKDGQMVRFTVTDTIHDIPVVFIGVLPDLFREGRGVVAEGKLRADGLFQASDVLAKHNETYMPREVAETLKKAGRWQEQDYLPVNRTLLYPFPTRENKVGLDNQ